MADRTQVGEESNRAAAPSMSDLIDRLSRFEGPPETFLVNLLAVQCYIAAAGGGAMLRLSPQGQVEVLALYPPLEEGKNAPAWLGQSVESAGTVMSSGTTVIRPLRNSEDLYGAPARQNLVMVPIRGAGNVRGAACFLIESSDEATLAVCQERLELTVSLLSLYEMRLTLQRRQMDLARLRMAMDLLGAVNEHDRFAGVAMALCNELASRLGCERVALGFLKGRYVHVKGLSHTEKFSRKMKLVQDIESAMEECLDQDVEIVFPSGPEATYVSRSTKELSVRHGPSAVVSVPLRRNGAVVGVLSLERGSEKPFNLEEIEALRLTCDLTTARLMNLHEHDRWVGARMAASVRKAGALAVGPKHTWVKLLVLGISGLLCLSIFLKGDYQAKGSFHFEATQQQSLPAPFDGYIEKVFVKPDDNVVAEQTVLGKLETRDLEKALIDARSDLAQAVTEQSKAMSESATDKTKMAEFQIAQTKEKKARAQIALLERRIQESSITSPISGKLISEDLSRHLRRPVKMGEVLFEVAPVESLRAVLEIPEDQIAEVRVGDRGELATLAYPEKRIGFTVDRIFPVAEVVEQENVFKVQVVLDAPDIARHGGLNWMAPGMKGTGKIMLGKQPYGKLYSRKLVNWVRMKLWI